ncbi:MAG: TadE/TadG family type IV pilus assembly protein [Stackebrandtia sp.]
MELTIIAPVLLIAFLLVAGLGRMAHARQQVESVATDAARAASLERTVSASAAAGHTAAEQSLGDKGLACAQFDVDVDVSDYRPGGVVRATVTCVADLSDVGLSGLPGSHSFEATGAVPIENFRGS